MPLLQGSVQALATASASSANPSTKRVSSLMPLSCTEAFRVLEALHPLPLSQQVTKLLGEGEGDGNRGIELSDAVNESELLLGPMGRRTHHHQRHGARGRGFALRHGLSADGFGPVRDATGPRSDQSNASIRDSLEPRSLCITAWPYDSQHSSAHKGREDRDQSHDACAGAFLGPGAVRV